MINTKDTFIYYYVFTPPTNDLTRCHTNSGYVSLKYFYEYQYQTPYQFFKVIKY